MKSARRNSNFFSNTAIFLFILYHQNLSVYFYTKKNNNRTGGDSIVAQQVKLLLLTHASDIKMSVQVPSVLLQIQLSANESGKAAKDGPTA